VISIRRAIGATAAALGLVMAPVATASVATANVATANVATARALSARTDPAAAAVELQLTKVLPVAVRPTDDLTVTGTIRNAGSTTAKTIKINLWLRPDVLVSRKAINTWLDKGTLTPVDREVASVTIPLPAPGASGPFHLEVPAGQTGLYSASSFGPRAIALEARAGGARLAALRSTIVWSPTKVTTRTKLSVVVPITSTTPTTHAGEANQAAAQSLAPNGRLQRILAATHDPSTAWAIDPSILTSVDRLITSGVDRKPDDQAVAGTASATPSTTPNSAKPSIPPNPALTDPVAKIAAQDWLNLFKSDLAGRDLFALPYGDLDLASVLKSSRGVPLLKTADQLGRTAAQKSLGAALDSTVAWPADGQVSKAVARSLAHNKRTAVILSSAAQKPTPALDYTPTGHSTVGSGNTSLVGLLYDDQLSTLLSSDAVGTPAATQTMLAQLAAITMEQPDTARHLLAVTPRTWDPNPNAVQTMMNTLGSAPWVSLQGVSDLRKASGPPRSALVYRKSAAAKELPIGTVSGAIVLDRGLKNFAPIFADPNIVQPLRERVISLLSVNWRQDREQLAPARVAVSDNVNGLISGIELVTPRTPIFTARKSPIPVTVINRTDYPIRVVVRFKPETGQLAFDKSQPVKVAANTNTQVFPQARALASGNVVVEAKLMTVAGVALGPGQTFTVKVRPEWEGRGMIVIGSILGLMLVIGLLRGIRRNRTRVRIPIEAVPDVDEQATQRAGLDGGSPDAGGSGGSSVSVSAAGSTMTATPMRTSMARPVNGPGPTAMAAPRLAPLPGSTSFRRPPTLTPTSDPDGDPVTGPMQLPTAMLTPEPDPKAPGGTVKTNGFRPPAPPRVGAAAPPE
jgi:hypothetical protein